MISVFSIHNRASSVLNNNAKLYGANNALDNQNESTSWYSDGNSDGDAEHSYIVNFHRKVTISSIGLQFQGGFVYFFDEFSRLSIFTVSSLFPYTSKRKCQHFYPVHQLVLPQSKKINT